MVCLLAQHLPTVQSPILHHDHGIAYHHIRLLSCLQPTDSTTPSYV